MKEQWEVHSLTDYKNFLHGGNLDTPMPEKAKALLFEMDLMLIDERSELTLRLQSLDEKTKVALIKALITNDHKVFCHILFPKKRDTLIRRSITMHGTNEGTSQWLNQTCKTIIECLFRNKDGELLTLWESQHLLSVAMREIPDVFIDLPSKYTIHAQLLPLPPTVQIAYDEPLTPLAKNRFSGTIPLDEFTQAIDTNEVDISEFIFLTLGVLQKFVKDNKEINRILQNCRHQYIAGHYEEAINLINQVCQEQENIIGNKMCLAIMRGQMKIRDVSFHQNYSRRFLENRIAALYQGQGIGKEAINAMNDIARPIFVDFFTEESGNEIAESTLIESFKDASSPEEAISLLLTLDEMYTEDMVQLEFELKESSQSWAERDRVRRKGFISEFHTALGLKGNTVYTRNRGIMRSSQPNYQDELSENPLKNKGADIYTSPRFSDENAQTHSAVYIADISGHAFGIASMLMIYLGKNEGLSTNSQNVNHFLKIFTSTYISLGFHSLLEVIEVFNQPHIKKIFEEKGVVLDLNWPDAIIEQAFKDTQEYTRKLCKQRALNQRIRSDLYNAAANGNIKRVNMLLSQNNDPNHLSAAGIPPLFIAIQNHHPKIIKALLAAGADPAQAFYIAIDKKNETMVNNILPYLADTDKALAIEEYVNTNANKEIKDLIHQYFTHQQSEARKTIELIKKDATNTWRQSAIENLESAVTELPEIHTVLQLQTLIKNFMMLDTITLPITPELLDKKVAGKPILFVAIENKRYDIVSALLEAGANPDITLADGRTPLFTAVALNNNEMVEVLLAHKAKVDAVLQDSKLSPLHQAVINNNNEMIKMLIAAGSPVNSGSPTHDPLVITTIKNGNEIATRLLIEAGANLACVSTEGESPLVAAFQQGNIEMFKLVLKHSKALDKKEIEELLFKAVNSNNLTIVNDLLEAGVSANALHDRLPAIYFAAKNGFTDITNALLKAGAKPDSYNRVGISALRISIKKGYAEVVQALLEHNATIDFHASYTPSPLMLAQEFGHPEVVRVIEDFLHVKMARLKEKIDQIEDDPDNPLKQQAKKAMLEYHIKISKDPQKFYLLANRVLFFSKLDTQSERLNQLLKENKIKLQHISETKNSLNIAFSNIIENKTPFSLLNKIEKSINEAVSHTPLKFFEPSFKSSGPKVITDDNPEPNPTSNKLI